MEDVSIYPNLTAELLRRGWQDEDVRKTLGLNVLRVMREAERACGGPTANRARAVHGDD